jgi:hypothetical protein
LGKSSAAISWSSRSRHSNYDTFAVTSPGNSDPGGLFQFVSGKQADYQFNLQTEDLAGAGTCALWFTVLGDPIEHSIQIVLK